MKVFVPLNSSGPSPKKNSSFKKGNSPKTKNKSKNEDLSEKKKQELAIILKNLSDMFKNSFEKTTTKSPKESSFSSKKTTQKKPNPSNKLKIEEKPREFKKRTKKAKSKNSKNYPASTKYEPVKNPIRLTFTKGPVIKKRKTPIRERSRGKTFETTETQDSKNSRVPDLDSLLKMVKLQKEFQLKSNAEQSNLMDDIFFDSEDDFASTSQSSSNCETSDSDYLMSSCSINSFHEQEFFNLFDKSSISVLDGEMKLISLKGNKNFFSEIPNCLLESVSNENHMFFDLESDEINCSFFESSYKSGSSLETSIEHELAMLELQNNEKSETSLESEIDEYVKLNKSCFELVKNSKKKTKKAKYGKKIVKNRQLFIKKCMDYSLKIQSYLEPITSLSDMTLTQNFKPHPLCIQWLYPKITKKKVVVKKEKSRSSNCLPHLKEYQNYLTNIDSMKSVPRKRRLSVFKNLCNKDSQ